jgi:hypothetical protein
MDAGGNFGATARSGFGRRKHTHPAEAFGPMIAVRTSVAQSLLALFMRLWWLKAVGTTFFLWAFFYFYFRIQSAPQFAVVDVPLTWLDRAIPMQAWAWIPYLSLWVYTSLPPAFQPDLRLLAYYGVCIFSVCATGLLCFYLWPTSVSGDRKSVV